MGAESEESNYVVLFIIPNQEIISFDMTFKSS